MRIDGLKRLECGGDDLFTEPSIAGGAKSPTKVLNGCRIEPIRGRDEEFDDKGDDIRIRSQRQVAFGGSWRETLEKFPHVSFVGWHLALARLSLGETAQEVVNFLLRDEATIERLGCRGLLRALILYIFLSICRRIHGNRSLANRCPAHRGYHPPS